MKSFNQFLNESTGTTKIDRDVLPFRKFLEDPSNNVVIKSGKTLNKSVRVVHTDKGLSVTLVNGTRTKTEVVKYANQAITNAIKFFGDEDRESLYYKSI